MGEPIIGAQDSQGASPLFLACQEGHVQCARPLGETRLGVPLQGVYRGDRGVCRVLYGLGFPEIRGTVFAGTCKDYGVLGSPLFEEITNVCLSSPSCLQDMRRGSSVS